MSIFSKFWSIKSQVNRTWFFVYIYPVLTRVPDCFKRSKSEVILLLHCYELTTVRKQSYRLLPHLLS